MQFMKPFLVLCFFACSFFVTGQNDPYVDYLVSLLKTDISDKKRVKTYSDLAEYIGDEKTWMSYNKKALVLARKKLKEVKGKARRFYIAVADAYNNYGFYIDNQDDKDNALKYYFKALNNLQRARRSLRKGRCDE